MSEIAEGDGLDGLMQEIRKYIEEGRRHGFFTITIEGEIVKNQKCQLTLEVSKSYRRYLPPTGEFE